jgi:GNAT superfamily N-acetyltransferase
VTILEKNNYFFMGLEDFEIKFVDSWPTREIVELYKAAGWWKETYDESTIETMIKGSFVFAVAVDSTGKAVGMGRVISDSVSDAYIQDLVVLPRCRGYGVGKKLVKSLIDHCLSHGLIWIGVVAEPGSEGFYRDIGLKSMEGYTLMLYRMEE